jgi:hypothetical protein
MNCADSLSPVQHRMTTEDLLSGVVAIWARTRSAPRSADQRTIFIHLRRRALTGEITHRSA